MCVPHPSAGEVWVTERHKLVRETPYQLTLGVKDTHLEATGDLDIFVTTVNQAPYFDPEEYHVRVPEKCGEVGI